MNEVVHLELHTPDLAGARSAYAALCGWHAQQVPTASGCYEALGVGEHIGGGIVECGTPRALWLPYVRVGRIDVSAARARELRGRDLLEPREGPTGWRAVVSLPAGGEIAFWQPKAWT